MNRWLDRLIARVVRHGRLQITWSDGTVSHYGEGGRSAHLRFKDAKAEWRVLFDPELALGETFMDGQIDFPGDGQIDFMRLIEENWDFFRSSPIVAALSRVRHATKRFAQNNNLWKARKNVAHHYDLDERLYRLFLDRDMQYSCAYFDAPDIGIEEAQWAKKRHLASKLALESGQEVLDIGSGWGGLGLYLADTADVNVTGVTLSTEQHRVSNQRAKERGLERQVNFQILDYRKLDRQFDRIVSVGMFEHVGATRYDEFFETVAGLLKPDGVAVIHSIGRRGVPGVTSPWFAKYIFPGGYIPSLSEVTPAVERSGLYTTDIEILRLHYAETLKAWRQRFRARWDEAAKIYDERFCRMWDFYLSGSEAAFRSGSMMVFQIQLTKELETLPITRDYMHTAEAELNATQAAPESLRLAGE